MNILLCCSVGMSTSLLVKRMEKVASEHGEEHNIWAVPCDSIRYHIKKADVVLLGPQIRFLLPEVTKLGNALGVPVDIINMVDYGTYNGESVLKQAKRLIANNQ